MIETRADVVPFRTRAPARHPRTLMETVYAAGSHGLVADDLPAKMVAVMLQAMGLMLIEEIQPDGSARPFAKGEARRRLAERPWRLIKPGFSAEAGRPDAGGAFLS